MTEGIKHCNFTPFGCNGLSSVKIIMCMHFYQALMSANHCFLISQNVLKKRDQVQAEYETKLEAVVFREDKKTPVSYVLLALTLSKCNRIVVLKSKSNSKDQLKQLN